MKAKTRSLRITTNVHKELKVFTSLNDESIIDFAGLAIMKELKQRGHTFVVPQLKSSKQPSKK